MMAKEAKVNKIKVQEILALESESSSDNMINRDHLEPISERCFNFDLALKGLSKKRDQ